MTVVRRYDRVPLAGNVQRTPQGGLRVPARLTRTGVLEYLREDGTVQREYRPPDEVFSSASLESLADATVTDLHQGMVDPQNYRQLTRGHVSGVPTQDGDFVAATLVVQDAAEIAMIEAGERREISCGYDCTLDMTPGVTPEGLAYDAIQRAITYNHAAIGPVNWGRAGNDVALRLDSKGSEVLTVSGSANAISERNDMTDIAPAAPAAEAPKTDGTCPTCGAPTDAEGKYAAPMMDGDPPTDAVQAKLDTALEEVKRLKSGRSDSSARDAIVIAATKVGVEVMRADGRAMSDDEIRRAVIGVAYPNRRLDGKSSAYLEVAYDDALDTIRERGLAGIHVASKQDSAGAPRDLMADFLAQKGR